MHIGSLRCGQIYYPDLSPSPRIHPYLKRVVDGTTLAVGPERWRIVGWCAAPTFDSCTLPCCNEIEVKGEKGRMQFSEWLAWGGSQRRLEIFLSNQFDGDSNRLVSMRVGDALIDSFLETNDFARRWPPSMPRPRFCRHHPHCRRPQETRDASAIEEMERQLWVLEDLLSTCT